MKRNDSDNNMSEKLLRAYKLLSEEIRHAEADGKNNVPSIRQLSSHSGLSSYSLWKAAHILEQEGKCYVVEREGIFLKQPDLSHRSQTILDPATPKWERILNDIQSRIVSGIIKKGESIPSVKELQDNYGVCYKTVMKALTVLKSRGLISGSGKNYRITSSEHRYGYGKIVIIGMKGHWGKLSLDWDRSRSFYHLLTFEASARRVSLETITYIETANEAGVFITADGKQRRLLEYDPLVLGYIILPWGIRDIRMLIAHIANRNRPVAVWIEASRVRNAVMSIGKKNVMGFDIDYLESVGGCAADFLLSLGHRSIAYISPYHNIEWSHNRLNGLRNSFIKAYYPDGVKDFCITTMESSWDYTLRSRSKFDIPACINLDTIETLFPESFISHFDRLKQAADTVFRDGVIYEACIPLFEEALRIESITAWVLCNDETAILALNFLEGKQIDVPGRLSVVGFDDRYDALDNQLTSYNFNVRGLVEAMLDFILNPLSRLYRNKKKIDISGTLVTRSTTDAPGSSIQ
jgi:DNA-binding LacI/PurR family transcriptional regulator/DNA-binding transcriptional regulator YhcF (GntR family)